jgi:hypothetical protein
MLLALDIGLTGFPLGMQGVKILLEPILGALSH